MRLTTAQWHLLVDVSYRGGTHCIGSYKPAKRLVELGLAKWKDGSPSSDWLNVTEQGRLALTSGREKE